MRIVSKIAGSIGIIQLEAYFSVDTVFTKKIVHMLRFFIE